jgi:hypothetical protein
MIPQREPAAQLAPQGSENNCPVTDSGITRPIDKSRPQGPRLDKRAIAQKISALTYGALLVWRSR